MSWLFIDVLAFTSLSTDGLHITLRYKIISLIRDFVTKVHNFLHTPPLFPTFFIQTVKLTRIDH